jgi:hypothetical protein
MEVSGQLHAMVALLPGKEPPVSIGGTWVGPGAGLYAVMRKIPSPHRESNSHYPIVFPESHSGRFCVLNSSSEGSFFLFMRLQMCTRVGVGLGVCAYACVCVGGEGSGA